MEIKQEQLDKMISDHKKWLHNEGKEGERFEFHGDLSGADLRYANLRKYYIGDDYDIYPDLSKSNLRGADLRYANLIKANIREADLTGALGLDKWKYIKNN